MIKINPKINKFSMSFKKLVAPQDENQHNPPIYCNGELIIKIFDHNSKLVV